MNVLTRLLRKLVLVLALVVPVDGAADEEAPLLLFAAASLGDALDAVLADYPEPVSVSLGGSGAMARQVAQGAPADAVMLANPVWADWLETEGLLLPETRRTALSNRIVLIGPPGAPAFTAFDTETLLARLGATGRLAIGDHRAVPAGQYAKAWLDAEGAWPAVARRVAEVENVRAALALVTRGEVPLGVVYETDLVAAGSQAVAVWRIPERAQPRIRYPVAAVTPRGAALAAYLASPDALETFATFGFGPPQP